MKVILCMTACLCMAMGAYAQTGTVAGQVSTSDGQPATGVTVRLGNTALSAISKDNGAFSINNVPAGDHTVGVSLIGYDPVSMPVYVEKGETVRIFIRLKVSARQLQEVVISSGRNRFYIDSSVDIGKLPLTNLENPQVYNVVSSALLREQMVTNFDDALRNVTGVAKLFTGGGDFSTDYSSRGFPTSANLRNGVASVATSDVDPANIERIEVLKGPSGTLFGSSLVSWGGFINKVTKQPYGHFGGELSYAGGSHDLSRFTADLNLPLAKDSSVLFRVNAAHTYKGSFMDYGFTKSSFLAPIIVYRPNDRLLVSLEAEFYAREGTSYPSFFIFSPMQASSVKDLPVDYHRSFTNNEITFLSPTTRVYAEIDYRISAHWRSQTTLSVVHGVNNGYYQWDNFLSGAGDSLVRTVTDWRNNMSSTTEIQQNFISDYHWGRFRNRLVAGVDVYTSRGTGTYYYITYDTVSLAQPGEAYLGITPEKIDQLKATGKFGPNASNDNTEYIYAAYVSDVFNLTERLIINAALRVDRFEDKGVLDPETRERSEGYRQTALSPKLGVVYQPLKDRLSVFANYSNGFQNNSGVDFNGKPFKPSNGNQLEGGLKMQFWQGQLSAVLSYFQIRASDLLVTDPVHAGFSMQNGKQTSKGLEATLTATPAAGLNLTAGYARTEKKWNGAGSNAGVSPNMVNAYASYHVSRGALKGLGAGIGGNYGDGYPPAPGYGITFPAYTILDASLFYERQGYRVGLKLGNLTDQHYWIGWYDMEPQMPRNFSASLAVKF